jgi:hypothetical protein
MYMVRMEVRTVGGEAPAPTLFQNLMRFVVLPLGVFGPFGTTILGSVAVSQIRRSRGTLGGLPLAFFDMLFFPVLIFDILLFVGWALLIGQVFPQGPKGPDGAWLELFRRLIVYVLPVLLLLVMDVLVVFFAWKAATRGLNDRK